MAKEPETLLAAAVDADEFAPVARLIGAYKGKAYSPYHNELLLVAKGGKLTFTKWNADGASGTVDVAADVEAEGRFVLPSRSFADALKLARGLVEFEQVAATQGRVLTNMHMRYQKHKLSFVAVAAAAAEDVPPLAEDAAFSIDAFDFRAAVAQTLPFVAPASDGRVVLTSMHMRFDCHEGAWTATFAAADGFKLSERVVDAKRIDEKDGDGPYAVNIPQPTAKALAKMIVAEPGNVLVKIAENAASFKQDAYRSRTSLVHGNFPDYKALFASTDKHDTTALVKTSELLAALPVVRPFAAAEMCKLRWSHETMEASTKHAEYGDSRIDIDATVEGADVWESAFNVKFLDALLKAAKQMPTNKCTLASMADSNVPLRVTTPDKGWRALLMPVHVGR